MGKISMKGLEGEQYGSVIFYACSNCIHSIACRLKSDYPNEYKHVVQQNGIAPKCLRSDGTGENVSKTFEKQLADDGTHHEKSLPDWQHENGRR
eukprot:1768846-Rhodomonas_salina.3